MKFRILGPLRIETDDARTVMPTRRRERLLLGILLVHVNSVVPADDLVELLWDEDPPLSARTSLRSHVSRIRNAIGADGGQGIHIDHALGGYRLRCARDSVDAEWFRRLTRAANDESDPATRFALLDEALRLWQGPLLADVASDRVRRRLGVDLDEQRAVGTEEWLAAGLAAGRHVEVLPRLAQLVDEYPLRERLVELQMTALYRAGRRAEALDAYASARSRFADGLGLDPSPALVRLQTAILRGDLDTDASPEPDERVSLVAELPPGVGHFTGRTAELDRITKYVENTTGEPRIVAISGVAGAGKTALALQWAQRAADTFPGGQLHVDLRGHDERAALAPAAVLRQFLRSLGFRLDEAPADEAALAARFRSAMRHRKMILLLDNATDVHQILPLLPATETTVVIITSRVTIASLSTYHPALTLVLDMLSADEAHALLARVVGAERLAVEPSAARAIVEYCGHLPLALRIAASRLSAQPARSAAELARELADRDSRLSALVTDDQARSVRAAFETGYRGLDAAAARMLRLIGLCSGPAISADLLVALDGDRDRATRALGALVTAHLVRPTNDGRYTTHDLIRLFAHESARSDESAVEVERVADETCRWYLAIACAVVRVIGPHLKDVTEVRLPADEPPFALDPPSVLRWLDGERSNVEPVIQRAYAEGRRVFVWQLTYMLSPYFMMCSLWPDLVQIGLIGLAAAVDLSDRVAMHAMHQLLGAGYGAIHHFDDALTHIRRGLTLAEAIGNKQGLAAGYNNLGRTYHMLERYDEACAAYECSVEQYRASGNSPGLTTAFANLARVHLAIGRTDIALDYATRALATCRELGDPMREDYALMCVADVHLARGDHPVAIEHYQAALVRYREIGDQEMVPRTLTKIGETYLAMGGYATASGCLRQAIEACRRYGDQRSEATALSRMGECRLYAGDHDGAAESLRAALAIRAQVPDADEEGRIHRMLDQLADHQVVDRP